MKCAVALVLCMVCAACADSPPAREQRTEWRTLGSWRGRGNQQLETFPIQGGTMRLQWQTTNAPAAGNSWLKVRVQSGDSGRIIAEPIDVRGAGRDIVSLVVEHHRVYLTVESANVDWTITAEEAVAAPK